MAEVVVIGRAPSREAYEEVGKIVGDVVPAGLIVHTASEVGDEIHIIDVWESREAADAFEKSVLNPAIEKAMAAAPPGAPTEGLQPEILEPFSVLRG